MANEQINHNRIKKAQYWRIRTAEDPRIQEAGRILREGGLVAFPTETVYGLGANGLDGQAVAKIFAAKHRPVDNPLILHVASLFDAKSLVSQWSPKIQMLAEKLWPGPLTIILPAADHIPSEVTAGLSTVAIRFPKHPIALALIEAAGVPIAAPSANRSGRPSPTLAEHVLEDLSSEVEVILDGGPCQVGLESTILDMSVDPPVILRPGGITKEALTQILGTVIMDQPSKKINIGPKAPGMKYRHYAPKAPLTLLLGKSAKVADFVLEQVKPNTAFLLTDETWAFLKNQPILKDQLIYTRSMGSNCKPHEMGRRLYDELRRCDQEKVEQIFIEGCYAQGYGTAVMNRLIKASANQIVNLD